jgi:hypothetical protein
MEVEHHRCRLEAVGALVGPSSNEPRRCAPAACRNATSVACPRTTESYRWTGRASDRRVSRLPQSGSGVTVAPLPPALLLLVKTRQRASLIRAHAGLRSVICADSGARCLGGEDHVLSVGGVDGHLVQTGDAAAGGLLPRVSGDVTGRWPPRGRPDAAGSSRCSGGASGRRWRRRRAAVADPEQQPRHERR